MSKTINASPEQMSLFGDALPTLQKRNNNKPCKSTFSPMMQGIGTNRFTQICTRTTPPAIDIVTGTATIAFEGYSLKIDNYRSTRGIQPSTHKLFNACVIALTKQNSKKNNTINPLVKISLQQYAELLGKPHVKSAMDDLRKLVKDDLYSLSQCYLSWEETKGNKVEDFVEIKMFYQIGIRNGFIVVGFSPPLAEYLVNAYVMHFPEALFRLDERNPSSLIIGRKLSLHYGMNNNKRNGAGNIISVKALLTECHQTIPSYAVVLESDKRVGARIVRPFESALDSLDFLRWEYVDAKGVTVDRSEMSRIVFADFISLYIRFSIEGFPKRKTSKHVEEFNLVFDNDPALLPAHVS